jgi:hypothetical protein
VLLYNAEVWPLRKEELQRLNRTYTGLMRQLARLGGRLRGKVDISHKAARDALGLPALESLLTQKRLRWVGHALRRAEGDASKAAVLYELQHNKAGAWAKLVWADMTTLGVAKHRGAAGGSVKSGAFQGEDGRKGYECTVRDLSDGKGTPAYGGWNCG